MTKNSEGDGTTADIIHSEDPEISVYPNPVKTTLFLKGVSESTQVSIYNSQGKLVLSNPVTVSQIEISNLTDGIYLIKFENKSGVTLKRFVKQ